MDLERWPWDLAPRPVILFWLSIIEETSPQSASGQLTLVGHAFLVS